MTTPPLQSDEHLSTTKPTNGTNMTPNRQPDSSVAGGPAVAGPVLRPRSTLQSLGRIAREPLSPTFLRNHDDICTAIVFSMYAEAEAEEARQEMIAMAQQAAIAASAAHISVMSGQTTNIEQSGRTANNDHLPALSWPPVSHPPVSTLTLPPAYEPNPASSVRSDPQPSRPPCPAPRTTNPAPLLEGQPGSREGARPGIPPSTSTVSRMPNTPYVAYARERGVAHPIPSTENFSGPTTPTFYSTWAGIHGIDLQPTRQGAPKLSFLRDHKRLLSSRLSGNHDWFVAPIKVMSFKYYVMGGHEHIRPDLARWKAEAARDIDSAKEMWSMFAEGRRWFLIPPTLQCDRTFARDPFECYYVDAMDKAFSAPADVPDTDIPLFQDSVSDRWWNVFYYRKDFLFEVYLRLNARALVSYDSYDTGHYNFEELRQTFSAVPFWMLNVDVPAAIPAPLAPLAYYFPSFLRDTTNPDRHRRAQRFLKKEYYGLAIAFWWNEMNYGGRQIVVPPGTVRVFREYCVNIRIVEGVTTKNILDMMMGPRVRDPMYWNKVTIAASSIPDCCYFDCAKGTGNYFPGMEGRKDQVQNLLSRRLRTVLRQNRRIQVRRGTPMALNLTFEDLNRIPGLGQFVKGQGWLKDDNVKVQELLAKLFGVATNGADKVREATRALRAVEADPDRIRAELQQLAVDSITHRPARNTIPPMLVSNDISRRPGSHRFPPPRTPLRLEHSLNDLPPIPRRPAPPPTPQFRTKRTYDDYRGGQGGEYGGWETRGNPRYRPEGSDGYRRWDSYQRDGPAGPSQPAHRRHQPNGPDEYRGNRHGSGQQGRQ